MRSNASLCALFFLLSACGGGAYANVEPELGLSPAAQAYGAPRDPYAQPQDPAYAQPAPQQQRYAQPPVQDAPSYGGPGASYERPDAGYDTPQQQPAYPQQQYRIQNQPRPAYSQPAPQAQDGYQDPAAGAQGPAGSSNRADRYDEVGYAGVRSVSGGPEMQNAVAGVHRSLPAGSFVEVTSLETGKTILVMITGSLGAADHAMDLSPGAARLLGGGQTGAIPVRIRKTIASPPDMNALRSGRPASDRYDTPPVLLNALRKQLPGQPVAADPYAADPAPSYSQPAPTYSRPAAPRPAAPAARGNIYVQVTALSNSGRANSVAQQLGGFVRAGGGLYRVQMGPFANASQAEAARGRAASAGFPDARVFTQN
jgi:rare lipoprotein A